MEVYNEEELKKFINDGTPDVVDHYIIECKDECRYRLGDIKTLEKGRELFEKSGITYNKTEYDNTHSVLEEKHKRTIQYLQDVEDALKDKQEHCKHDWKLDWHDSHYEYYYCTKCGKTDRW